LHVVACVVQIMCTTLTAPTSSKGRSKAKMFVIFRMYLSGRGPKVGFSSKLRATTPTHKSCVKGENAGGEIV